MSRPRGSVDAMPRRERSASNGRADGRKLGEVLAERIENEIIDKGWPVGEVLGSEAELIEKYNVSRAVFREAMRIVDHHGVAEMRRGPGGGLVVAEPDMDAAIRTVSLHLQFQRLAPSEINEVRMALELTTVRLATERLTPEGEDLLRRHLDRELENIMHTRELGRRAGDLPTHDFHLLVAEATGNPALRLFVQIAAEVTSLQSPRSESLDRTAADVHRAHSRIAEAILQGDAAAAERRMRRHLETVLRYVVAAGSGAAVTSPAGGA
jgi:DNA-binding FadR family transcriptional regulator